MKKEIYNSAFDKIEMSHDCVESILDKLDTLPQPEPLRRPAKKLRFTGIMVAAAVLLTGTITVAAEAGAIDWIKGFFSDDFIISEDIMEMSGEMLDFKCESQVGIELSPVGVISTGTDLYCMLRADKLPEGITAKEMCMMSIHDEELIEEARNFDDGKSLDNYGWSSGLTNVYYGDNIFGAKVNSDIPIYTDGQKLKFAVYPLFADEDRQKEYIKEYGNEWMFYNESTVISFTLRSGRSNNLDIDYSLYECSSIPERDYKFMFNEINITPLSISTRGEGSFYANETISSPLKVIMTDGSEAKLTSFGSSSCGNADIMETGNNTTLAERAGLYEGNYYVTSYWQFDQPVNPRNISEIYLGEMKIFDKAEFSESAAAAAEKKEAEQPVRETDKLSIDYSKYTCSDTPKFDYKFLFDKIDITPLSLIAKGGSVFYGETTLADDVTIIFDDKTEIKAKFNDIGHTDPQCLEWAMEESHGLTMQGLLGIPNRDYAYKFLDNTFFNQSSTLSFPKPVDPDSISEIYLGEMKIFDKNEFYSDQN